MKKKLAIILDQSDIKTCEFNKYTIFDFIKLFGKIDIIDVSNIVKHQDSKDLFFSNSKQFLIQPNNINELKSILKKENYILMYCLNNRLRFFSINFLLCRLRIKKFIVSNVGYNPENYNFHEKQNFFRKLFIFYNFKIINYFIRFLVLLKILPSYEFFFESSSYVIDSIKNGISYKIKKKISFLDFSYYKKIIKINSRSYDEILRNKSSISNDYIVFIDGMIFDHHDVVIRTGLPNEKLREQYYSVLRKFLNDLQILYEKKVIICLHPSNNFSEKNDDFKGFKIIKFQTVEYINKADVIVFHEGSSIIQGLAMKKKIINLQGSFLSNYINMRCEMYVKALNLKKYNLENYTLETKKVLDSDLIRRCDYYNDYIKKNIISEKNITSTQQIIDYFNKNI